MACTSNHLFWGVLLLMATGFGALATRSPQWHLRIAFLVGIALGLTVDEFATAGAAVAALLGVYGFGQPLWHAIVRDVLRRR